MARRYAVGPRSAVFFYVGVLGEPEEDDSDWSDGVGPRVANYPVELEDGEWSSTCWAELQAQTGSTYGHFLVPADNQGRLFAARRTGSALRLGLVIYDQSPGSTGSRRVRVLAAMDEPPQGNTTTGRQHSSLGRTWDGRTGIWKLELIPSSVWPGADRELSADERVGAIWAWIQAGGPQIQEPAASPPEPPQPPADPLPRGPRSRRPLTVRERVLDHMPEVVRFPGQGPQREHTWGALGQFLDDRRGRLNVYRPRPHRFLPLSREEDVRISELAARFGMPKASTFRTLRSHVEGFRQACNTRCPPTALLPLTFDNVLHWWLRKWAKKHVMRKLHNHYRALRELASAKGYFPKEDPPGVDPFVHQRIRGAQKALEELDETGTRRAFPFTLNLFRLLYEDCEVNLEDPQHLQWWARALLAHCGMCRGEDHKAGRARYGDFNRRSGEARGRATWFVRPGKAHALRSAVEVPRAVDADSDIAQYSVGHVMDRYLSFLRARFTAIAPDAPLFPDLGRARSESLVKSARPASDDAFISWFRSLCQSASLPTLLVDRISFHSFRSGGCTDLFEHGSAHPGIIEYIQRQGRWSSTCFRIYLRIRSTSMADVAADTLEAAAREAETDADRQRVGRLRGFLRAAADAAEPRRFPRRLPLIAASS